MAAGWWKAWRRRDAGWNAVLVGAAVPFVFFGYVALREDVAPHWGAPGIVLGAAVLALTVPRPRRLVAWGAGLGIAISVAAVGLVAFATAALDVDWPLIGTARGAFADTLAAAVANDEVVAEVQRRLAPGEMMASESYTDVHLYAFLSKGRMPTRLARVHGGIHGLASLYWYLPETLRGKDFLFVTERDGQKDSLRQIFESVSEESPFVIRRDGRTVRRVLFLRCRDLLRPEGVFTRLEPGRS
jgi:hypothetical protein